MPAQADRLEKIISQEYQHGFVSDIESDTIPPGLNEDIIRLISHKKQEPRVYAAMAPTSLSTLAKNV